MTYVLVQRNRGPEGKLLYKTPTYEVYEYVHKEHGVPYLRIESGGEPLLSLRPDKARELSECLHRALTAR